MTGIQSVEEQVLLDEAKALFGELFDVLNSRNLLRKTTIPIDIAKLKKIWKNTIHYGDAFNEISRKFKRFQSEARASYRLPLLQEEIRVRRSKESSNISQFD